jgi:hypothetical protein
MARVDAQIPKSWDQKLESIKKERNTPKRQLVKDAIYLTYIKPKDSECNE